MHPATRYAPAEDLWILTSFFNPRGYTSKRLNYERFAEPIRRAGMRLLTVECAFPWTSFDLGSAPDVIQLRAKDVLWQKERLLNVAIRQLPPEARKVAWLDCDIAFASASWAVETSQKLDKHPVVQLFDRAIRLPRGDTYYRGRGDIWHGFAATLPRDADGVFSGRFDRHGHTGFGWAARRDFLDRHGLYDTCVAGSGDHLMAHAFCGDWDSSCIDRIVGGEGRHREYFRDWSQEIYPSVRARVSHVPGTVLHFWHGDFAKRRYVDRNRELAEFAFDPRRDLKVGASGCWEWASAKPDLHRWAFEYFGKRDEDGDVPGLGGEVHATQ